VENLLSTACLLQLDTVVSACCSFLSKQLHPSNCLGIRQFADTQGCSQLYHEANDYVVVSRSCLLLLVTGRKAGIKITFVGIFWFVAPQGRLCALIIVKFGREEVAPKILLTTKNENFGGSFGEFRPRKHEKVCNNLKNARKKLFLPHVDESLGQKL